MSRVQARLHLLWVVMISTLFLPSVAWSGSRDGVSRGEVSGSVAVHGCEVHPQDLLIRARPALPPRHLRAAAGIGQRSQVVRAIASATPGRYEFRFSHLAPRVPYRLGVKLVGSSARRCGTMVWDASRDPLVMGGQEPVVFEAYTVASQIEVWGEAGPQRAEPGWFGADAFEYDDPAAGTRHIRWRSGIRGVTGGRLQVSLRPFPKYTDRGYNPCGGSDNGGIVLEKDIRATPGEWTAIPIDFHALLGAVRPSDPDDTRGDDGPADDLTEGLLRISENDRTALSAGRPIHVRVLPLRGEEPICDPDRGGVPPEVALAKALLSITAKPAGEPVFSIDKIYYSKPELDAAHPKAGEVCYRATRTHELCSPPGPCIDSTWDFAIVHNTSKHFGGTVEPGFQFCVPNSYWDSGGDDGWLESFVNSFGTVLTAIVDAAGKAVNFASAAWEAIQDYAVGAVASGLSELGVPCDDTCKAALEMGLEVGLASMGMPPSLPNFDELVDHGADYMAAQVGSQIGVPSVLTDYASDEAQKFIKKAVKNMKDRGYSIKGLPDWLVPDLRFEPALLTLELYGTGVPLPSRPGIIRADDPIYAGRFVQLPKLLPKKEMINIPGVPPFMRPPLRFPMVLEPSLYGLSPAPASKNEYDAAVWDKNQWLAKRYAFGPFQGCYHLYMVGLAPLGEHIFKLTDIRFTTQNAWACSW